MSRKDLKPWARKMPTVVLRLLLIAPVQPLGFASPPPPLLTLIQTSTFTSCLGRKSG